MSFDKNKTIKLYRVKSSEMVKNQGEEIIKTSEDFAQRNMSRSGMIIKAHINLYHKHLKEKLELLIATIFEIIDEKELISSEDEENIIEYLKNFVDKECEYKQNDLRSLLASTGLNNAGIGSSQVATIITHFNDEKKLKIDYLRHLIEKHNFRANELKKNTSFWRTKNGTITAVATLILAITSSVSMFNGFGLFTSSDEFTSKIPHINKFDLSEVGRGRSGKAFQINWDVTNVDSIVISSGIGKVTSNGQRIIYPKVSTTIILSAYLNNIGISISKKVVVNDSLNNP